jgi:hypothetical protein
VRAAERIGGDNVEGAESRELYPKPTDRIPVRAQSRTEG